ncbi:hypothetical protein DFH06DRAFT_928285, partial [Mycena polygramma]
GEVTALAISEFQDACNNYFAHKGTDAERQVAIVLGCFEEPKINNWLRPAGTRARIMKLSFLDFIGELKLKFLRSDWKETTRKEILSSHQ